MSADNGIYILITTDKFKQISENYLENTFDKGITAYRVAHAQAIDNFDWFIQNELHNLGAWLAGVFGDSPIFYDKLEALEYANKLSSKFDYLEYGICNVDASKFNFPGY